MREIEFIYTEVLNASEQLFIFSTTFNKMTYSHYVIVNTVQAVEIQDLNIATCVLTLQTMKKVDAKDAVDIE